MYESNESDIACDRASRDITSPHLTSLLLALLSLLVPPLLLPLCYLPPPLSLAFIFPPTQDALPLLGPDNPPLPPRLHEEGLCALDVRLRLRRRCRGREGGLRELPDEEGIGDLGEEGGGLELQEGEEGFALGLAWRGVR